MLPAQTAAFAMSQAFRTVAAMLASPLQAEFHLAPQQLGTFAGSFHFAFGAMQLVVGVGIDLRGVPDSSDRPSAGQQRARTPVPPS
jgi:hypothetical protein